MTIARPTAELFDPTGVSSLGVLSKARNIQWQDILSQQGSATFEVPLDDSLTSSITDRCIVKFSLYGSVRFGCRIVSESVQLAVDGTRWLRFENQPGLLQLLADAVVAPEYGLDRASAADRLFGFMSIDGTWRVTADWQNPLGIPTSSDIRGSYPPDIATLFPEWLAFNDPDTDQPAGTVNYYRYPFTVIGTNNLWFAFAGDNFMTLYIDGEEVATPDPTRPFAWKNTTIVQKVLLPGGHLLAAKVVNAAPTWGVNPLAFVGIMFTYDADGNRGGIVFRTDSSDTNWLVSSGATLPGWTRGQVLKQLVTEAQTRGIVGPALLVIGFTDTEDTDSVAWADPPGQHSFPVGTVGLADVASQLAETAIDVAVDPATMTLNCWVRKGSDLSATVELKLGDAGGTLIQHETTKTVARFTDVYTQLADGTWQVTSDSGAVTALGGHVEVALNVPTSATETATNLAEVQLAESAQPLISSTTQPTVLTGAQAYVDYDLGDTIKVPAHRNDGTMKARVLGITVDATTEPIKVYPQYVLDGSV